MSRKSLILILLASIVVWYASRFLQSFIAYLFSQRAMSFLGIECTATGYPIATCINQFDSTRYIYFVINILFWFAVIAGIKWFALDKYKKRTKRKLRKCQVTKYVRYSFRLN